MRGCCRAPGKAPDSYNLGGQGRLGPEAQAVSGKWLQVLVCVKPSEGWEPAARALDPRSLVFASSAQGQHKGGPWEVLRPRADFVRGRQRLGQSKKRLARRVSADHQPPLHASSGGRALSPEATPLQPESQTTRSVSNQRPLAQPCAWPWGFGGGQDLVYTTVAPPQGRKPR